MSGAEMLAAAAVVLVAGILGVVAASLKVARSSVRPAPDPAEPEAPPVLWPTSVAPLLPGGPGGPAEDDPEATVPPRPSDDDPEATVPPAPPAKQALNPEATVPPGPPPPPQAPRPAEVTDSEDEETLPPEPPPPQRPPPGKMADSLGALPRLGRPQVLEEPTAPWIQPRPVSLSIPVPVLEQLPPPASPDAPPSPPPIAPAPVQTTPTSVKRPSLLELLAPSPRRRILRQLPDCLDLVVTCLEGGMAVDMALQRTSQELAHAAPELCVELERLRADQAAGVGRSEALASLRRRCPVDPLHEFLAATDEAATMGTSIASGLARQAEALRRDEAARIEAWARRLPTTVMLTAFVFLIPPVFVLLLGSSVIQAIRAIGPGL